VIVDQELSLFSDTTPLLNAVDLQVPTPSSNELLEARSAREWNSRMSASPDARSGQRPFDGLSLRDLFSKFIGGELSNTDATFSPLQLRVLLHPLQTLVCQLRQFLSYLPDSGRKSTGSSITRAAIKARLEEISALLRQWYSHTERSIDNSVELCWTTRANLIMYHLIFLNTRTSLGFIEKFARGEVSCSGPRHASQWLYTHCLEDPEQVYFHSGQVLRHIKAIPLNLRPPWWSGALYRAGLIIWATTMAGRGGRRSIVIDDSANSMDEPFAIDDLGPGHPAIEQYLQIKEGIPALSRRDGSLERIDDPNMVLRNCISFLQDDLSTRSTEGIMGKLQCLLDRWSKRTF
jgi:hypothetical protein